VTLAREEKDMARLPSGQPRFSPNSGSVGSDQSVAEAERQAPGGRYLSRRSLRRSRDTPGRVELDRPVNPKAGVGDMLPPLLCR
jgi:hypothetical protein